MPSLLPLPQAFTNSGLGGTDLPAVLPGQSWAAGAKEVPAGGSSFCGGGSVPTFQPLKVTRRVWENQEAHSPGSRGSPCPAGAAECDLAQQVGVQVWGAELHPFTLSRGWGLGARSRG